MLEVAIAILSVILILGTVAAIFFLLTIIEYILDWN